MKENKDQRKEAEDEGVFLRFGDDLAVDNNPHRAAGLRRKTSIPRSPTIIEGSHKEVVNETPPSSRKRLAMVRLVLAIVMVGVFVALAAKVMLVRPPPGILALTEAISSVLELENKGDREIVWSLGLLASKRSSLEDVKLQESREESSRRFQVSFAVEEPLKIQRVWLVGLSWLGWTLIDHLRLGFVPPPPQRQATTANKENFRFI